MQILHSSKVKVGMVTFWVHVQAVGFAAVISCHVVVADGDVEGVAPRDVVTQRFPVNGDQPRPGLCDLQPLWSPHWFYEERRKVNFSFTLSLSRIKR